MTDTCPICPDSLAHKPGAYLQGFGLLSPSDHQSTNDKLNYGSDVFLGKHAAAPRNGPQIGSLD
jgi:hypothetical protein